MSYSNLSGEALDLFFESFIVESEKPKISLKVIDNNPCKSKKDVDDVVSTLNKRERKLLCLDDKAEDHVGYMSNEETKAIIGRFIVKVNNVPVSVFDLKDVGKHINASVVTRNGEEYRNKGYAVQAIKKGLRWYDNNKSKINKPIVWWSDKKNVASQRIAEKCGFKKDLSLIKSKDKWLRDNWIKYVYK